MASHLRMGRSMFKVKIGLERLGHDIPIVSSGVQADQD